MPTSSDLEARLSSMERRRSRLNLWRGVHQSYEPLSARGTRIRGGRWNPPGLAALYASFDRLTVRAELARGAERRGLPEEAVYPVVLVEIAVRVEVVDLSEARQLEALGVVPPFSVLTTIGLTREIGTAAARLGLGALIVPSVVTRGNNAVIFPGNIAEPIEIAKKRRIASPARWP